MANETKDRTNEGKDEPFRIRSKVECLYVFLDQIRQEQVQHTLDIDYWQKRIIKEKDSIAVKNLEIELNGYKEKLKEVDTRIRITKSLIEDEKKQLSSGELNTVLEKVNPKSEQDMVRSTIDYFTMATVPFEINLRFWESKSIETNQPEVRNQIELNVLPNIKKSIELNNGGKINAEEYLKTLEYGTKLEKIEIDNKIN